MFIDLCSQKVFSPPPGLHIHADMSLLAELARFFIAGAINISRRWRLRDA
jgi:hypothetical protein